MMDRLDGIDKKKMKTIVQRLDKAVTGGKGIRLTNDQCLVLQGCLIEMTLKLMTMEMTVEMVRRDVEEMRGESEKSVIVTP